MIVSASAGVHSVPLSELCSAEPLRLMYEHIKLIHPYLDVGFGISGHDPRGSKRSSEALKWQRCPLWRARQRTCAGGFHIYAKTQHPGPPIHWIDVTIPASIAMNVAQAIVHHKSSALTLTVVQNGSSKSLQFKRDWPTNSSDLGHIAAV